MGNSPLLWGPNNTAINLQNQIINANGQIASTGYTYNYLTNPGLELGNLTGWSLFTTTMTGVFPTGSITNGAASISDIEVSSTNPLTDVYSLLVGSSGAISAGQGFISDAFTLNASSIANMLSFRFNYSVVNGVIHMDFSGTSSNTWAVYLYDVANSAWLQPAGVYNLVQNNGVGLSTGTFQTSANATQYRLAVLCINSTSSACAMKFDDFYVGPQITAAGAAISDPVSYTPTFTGLGTVSNVDFVSWREGAFLKGKGNFTCGTTTASLASFTLGFNGGNGNVTTISTIPVGNQIAGKGDITATGTTFFGGVTAISKASTNLIYIGQESSANNGLTPLNGSSLASSGQTISIEFEVQIVGWSSSTAMSSSTDTRVVAFRAYGSTTSISTTAKPITFNTVAVDTHGGYSGNIYKIPVTGYYSLQSSLHMGQAAVSGGSYYIGNIYNVTAAENIAVGQYIFQSTTSNSVVIPISITSVYLTAGTQIQLNIIENNVTTPGFVNDYSTMLSINRLSGPATIAADATVVASYYCSTNQSASTTQPINFDTKEFDSTDSVTTGSAWKFTAPISGIYEMLGFGAPTTNTNCQFQTYKNGSSYKQAGLSVGGGGNQFSCKIPLLAGEYFDLRTLQSVTVQGGTLSDNNVTRIEISRIGNYA